MNSIIMVFFCISAMTLKIRAQTPIKCRFRGNDLSNMKVASFQDCYKFCLNETKCNAYTLLSSKACYIHNFLEDSPKITVDSNSTALCGVISKSSRAKKPDCKPPTGWVSDEGTGFKVTAQLNGNCYVKRGIAFGFINGTKQCKNKSGPGYLPKIDNQEEYNLLVKMVAPSANEPKIIFDGIEIKMVCTNAWIGAYSSDGIKWYWDKDGSLATIKPEWWETGEPSPLSSGDCKKCRALSMSCNSGKLISTDSTASGWLVCEKENCVPTNCTSV